MGGTEEAFAALSNAYSILTNAQNRLHYDQTGLEPDPSSEEHEALAVIANIFRDVLMKDPNNGRHPLNYVKWTVGKVNEVLAKVDRETKEMEEAIRVMEARAKRVRRRKGVRKNAQGSMLWDTVVQETLTGMKKSLEMQERRKRVGTIALRILESYEGDDPPVQEFQTWEFVGTFQSTTTGGT